MERLPLALALVAALLTSCFSQTNNPVNPAWATVPQESESAKRAFPAKLRSELVQIRDAALADDYAYDELEYLTDSIGPRLAGSPQAEAAASYVAEEMRKLGLDVHLESAPVRHFERGMESAELVQYPGQVIGTTQRIYVTALMGNSPTPPSGITGDVIVVNSFEELKQLGREKIAGKIVLFNEIYDHKKAMSGQAGAAYRETVRYRTAGAGTVAELGGSAMLVRSAGDGAYRLPHAGASLEARIPAGAISAEDAGLISRLASRGRVRIRLTLTSRLGPTIEGHNVIADLKGSEHPEQVVIVSGHLDSWDLATGAIDDGAGVVAAMEAAELLHKLHFHPRRTLRVIAWINEEMGATGATAYAREYAADPANHLAAIESDLGAEHPLGFHVKASEATVKQLSPVQDVLARFGANLLELVPESPESDIEPLAKAGVPAFGIWQNGLTYFTYHHTPADTLDKVVPQELRENAACMAVMGYALAEMAEPLEK